MLQKTQRFLERERLVNAAHRFAKICRNDPVKLFGLLYLLDIGHYREIGRSCTGEIYYAMADGPAPGTLRPLMVMRNLELDAAIGVLTLTDSVGPWNFDPRYYCTKGLDILTELETTYKEATSRDLTLDDANAWWKVYTKRCGVGAIIPYEMTLSLPRSGIGNEKAADRKSFARRFGVGGTTFPDYGDSPKPITTSD